MAEVKGSRAPTHDERVEQGYYLYGLVDPQALRETGDRLLSIFYVGKGTRARWQQHERDVLSDLRAEVERLERHSSKAERIRKILERGEQVPALRLSAGYLDEQDAYYAESLAIDTIDAALTAAGRPGLSNATPGRHAGFVWLREHFTYTEALAELLSGPAPEPTRSDEPTSPSEILVKGTADELEMPAQRRADPSRLPRALVAHAARVQTVQFTGPGELRRGWDPLDPWTDAEARERGYRYWPIAEATVTRWLAGTEQPPGALLLGVPARNGETVVRYAWEVDPEGTWEYYLDLKRWGVPLGRRLLEHPRLGHALYEERNGRRVQVLFGFAGGIRVLPAAERQRRA